MTRQNIWPDTPVPNSTNSEKPHIQRIEFAELDASPTVTVAKPGAALIPNLNPLQQVKVTLQVCVGAATLTVGELLNAQAQQVLVLDTGLAQPVDLLLEGQVVARGQLVAVGDQFAVRLVELPVPLGLQSQAAQ